MAGRFLEGQVAVVTGAGRGIGRATAEALARAGARLAVAARTVAELEETAILVQAQGVEGLVVPTDVAQAILYLLSTPPNIALDELVIRRFEAEPM